MNQYPNLIISYLVYVILLSHLIKASELCSSFSSYCNHQALYRIQFPFWVPEYQPAQCGYPGFELSCNSSSRTLLSFAPEPFIVETISYPDQVIWLSDPNHCIPKRVMDLSLKSTPYSFEPAPTHAGYTFVNCSGTQLMKEELPSGSSVISCMSGGNYTVVATFDYHAEKKMVGDKGCEVVKRIYDIEFWWKEKSNNNENEMNEYYYPKDFSTVLMRLSWGVPRCGDCVVRGGECGFAADYGLEVTCFNAARRSG